MNVGILALLAVGTLGAIAIVQQFGAFFISTPSKRIAGLLRPRFVIEDPRFGNGIVEGAERIADEVIKLKVNIGKIWNPKIIEPEYHISWFAVPNWLELLCGFGAPVIKNVAKNIEEVSYNKRLLLQLERIKTEIKLMKKSGIKREMKQLIGYLTKMEGSKKEGFKPKFPITK